MSLDRGDFINMSIKDVFVKENLKSGWLSGLGAVYNIELGYYDIKIKEYCKKHIQAEHELTSLTGNVSFVDSDYFVHTHVTLSDIDFKSFGGHLFDAQIAAAGEFKIDLFEARIPRQYSENIGLKLWCIDNENN